MSRTLFTIGYEGRVIDGLVERLRASGVRLLVDVRAVASSRKPGFSKTRLAASLDAAGIAYVHLRALGTPKPGREAARRGDAAGLARIYAAHLDTEPARAGLSDAAALAAGGGCCLLCFEADPACCHRRILAERLRAAAGHAIVDL